MSLKIVTVVGARPQFIKAAAVSRVLRRTCAEVLVHTGQHYDDNMSKVFFDELDVPPPDCHLGIGSGGHGAQTGAMLAALEEVLVREKPDRVLVYGDTNSTLAGALAAAKLHLPVAHVEAGLRSFNRRMPEEINRVLTDHLSDLLFCPGETAVAHLAAEGIVAGVHAVGDVMHEALRHAVALAERKTTVLERLGLAPNGYALATLHRAENVDDPARLAQLLAALREVARRQPVVFPVHPRTRKLIEGSGLRIGANIRSIDPVGYLDMIELERECDFVVTDSGGVQKEAYFFKKSCITLRDATEWVETVSARANVLVGADGERIREAILRPPSPSEWPALFGDGNAGELILDEIRKAALP